jgi:2',3'-cyclic-nucleotide 2'-phosphodiesterase
MRILFIGDIVGRLGRVATSELLPKLKDEFRPDVVIANGENSANGVGITKRIYDELIDMGIDVITSGNHIWDKKEILQDINACTSLIRPANYPDGAPGVGYKIFAAKDGTKYAVINLIGRVFMPPMDDPFKCADKLIEKIKEETNIILVDIHAEATSEKAALGWHLDGRVSAVIGTHTHVQTSDERILLQGTAFITDAGMVGSYNSVIGVGREQIIKRFISGLPERFEADKTSPALFNGLIIDIDDKGKAKEIKRILRLVENVDIET